ncbi:MAG: M23 family metallopeptidase [Candidatus Uhrbacteria bacterium]
MIKQKTRPAISMALWPVRMLGRFLFKVVFIQLYRLGFWIKHQLGKAFMPAKNRLVFLFSNRYTIHFAVVTIAAVVSVVNFSGSEVRAENFGERSTLYALVATEDLAVMEEVVAEEIRMPEPSSYLGEGLIVNEARVVFSENTGSLVTMTLGGGALVAPTMTEIDASVAPRQEVETYVVQSGDTVSGIAESFGVSSSSLLWANDLSYWSYIRPGDELKVPPTSGVLHTVVSGDTVSSIAKKYEAEEEKIISFNRLADADDLVVGEDIMVPEGRKRTVVPTPVSSGSSYTSTSSSSVGSYSGGGWYWPTDMRVITQYYGWRHNGLDVDGTYSTNNYAAKDGIVTYAGWLGGYGLLVTIDHGNGVETRYGHFSSIGVSVGQYVSGGQYLGKTGTTGRSTGTHLHFEVRINGQTRNPLEFIR